LSEEHDYYSGDEVDFGDAPALPDTSKFSHILEKEMQTYVPAMFRHRERSPLLRVFFLTLLIISSLILADVLIHHLNLFYKSGYW